ncbi:MAG: XTP/dITP diphosphatase [Planctomycetes bacterium]|nr:XTP/dITP diphosphatase [Planctomycetota bacterium]MBU1517897.1 XTP/dITP diphosphatase [Planctomycetota bacterium]MBU2458310.1 XTP/dITP diphosphatase [Planctomycetota bacterium]
MKILLATTNPGKLKEISEMLDFNIDWKSLSDFPDIKEIVEDGETFAENARKKALGYAKQTGLWTLADDSGLVVDALSGEPGVKSARFSGEKEKNRTLLDHKNMAKLLDLLKDVPKEKRTARFLCCLCLASPEKVLIETQGRLEGFIAEKEAGNNGFGYDPVFFVPSLNKTVAQLSREEKNAISHRGQAVKNLKPLLEKLLKTL